jgi:hypothetical protein
MACVFAKIWKETLAERGMPPVKSFDVADQSKNHVPEGIGFIGLPRALQALENHTVSCGPAPSIQANDLQPCHTD